MSVRRVSAEEAARMMEQEGYVYVDVRSIPEFDAGHPDGAYNIPIMHMVSGGMMAPNPDFLRVLGAAFPPESRLILGCRSGARSLQAAHLLLAQGFRDVVDQRAGFAGVPGEAGWVSAGLPVATEPSDGRSYEQLAAAAKP